jgi:potassium/chloride transporter 9
LQLGVILNTVPAWKKAYKLRVAVFVEYESDVEEERGRVKTLLENLRIEAEVLVFWLASGNLPTYEIIVNGASPGKEAVEEVRECLKGQEWWEELQKIRGNRGVTSATEDLSEIANIFTDGTNWPDSSFQQGPRGERIERFLGLRRLLKKGKRKHTMSGITKLGVSLGMRTHRLSDNVMSQHATTMSASEDSESDPESDSEDASTLSAASEGDIDDFISDDGSSVPSAQLIRRRRSHGDSMRGPPPSKKSTGEAEIKVPQRPSAGSLLSEPTTAVAMTVPPAASAPDLTFKRSESPNRKSPSISNLSTSLKANSEGSSSKPPSLKEPDKTPARVDASSTRPASVRSERPTLSRHASQPKFSSKPVPITRVATEDGPGPSIMFTDTPSPPTRRASRLPSAYRPNASLPDHISEVSENAPSPTQSRRGSMYSTQALPISFNDLPCRAQHLILNQLMRSKSKHTAVMFTTLPSPVEGTSRSVESSAAYLGDLEVLCRGCPPVLMVHSNSMTVTMSL